MAVLDIRQETARRDAASWPAATGGAFVCDVSDSASVDATFARIEAELGPPDILVNNAGAIVHRAPAPRQAADREAARGGRRTATVTTPLDALVRLEDDEWRRMLAIHLDGDLLLHARGGALDGAARQRRDREHVVDLRPRGLHRAPALLRGQGRPSSGSRRPAAKELIVQGVRVNAVAPGHVGTATLQGEISEERARDRRVDAGGAAGRPGGDRGDRGVPRLRRRELLRRRHAEPQRRAGHGVAGRRPVTDSRPHRFGRL